MLRFHREQNAGAYILPSDLKWPESLTNAFSLEKEFLMPEVRRLAPAAFEATGFFLDIGIPEDLDRAQTELRGLWFCRSNQERAS